jgi:alpha-galactosidase
VEVPCLVSGGGIQPCRVEDYPEQLAGLNRQMINVQLLAAQGALDGDRTAICRAVALDPNASSKLGLEELKNMTDELFEALKSEIDPRFFA